MNDLTTRQQTGQTLGAYNEHYHAAASAIGVDYVLGNITTLEYRLQLMLLKETH